MANELNLESIPTPELSLTLGDELQKEVQAIDTVSEEQTALQPVDLSSLSEEEQKIVTDFAQKIDITDSNIVMQYGAASQKHVAGFSQAALENVRTKDLGEVGGMIGDLVVELKGFSVEDNEKGLLGVFKKGRNKVEALKTRYDKAEVNVDKISRRLEDHQITLLKDIATLDQMYEKNLMYFKELTMYILAGKTKLQQERSTTLVQLREKAQKSGLAEDAQAANDFAALCERFEKKLYDLELTRTVSIQMSPQIRMIQNNDTLMAEKIQSTIVNTIPLWKSQMVLALGLAHSEQAMKAQREVTNMTNSLLKKNAEMLKTGTVETVKESERGIVDIETLTHTNKMLISTLDEVEKLQTEGRQKRAAAEVELMRIEDELRNKLLKMSK